MESSTTFTGTQNVLQRALLKRSKSMYARSQSTFVACGLFLLPRAPRGDGMSRLTAQRRARLLANRRVQAGLSLGRFGPLLGRVPSRMVRRADGHVWCRCRSNITTPLASEAPLARKAHTPRRRRCGGGGVLRVICGWPACGGQLALGKASCRFCEALNRAPRMRRLARWPAAVS